MGKTIDLSIIVVTYNACEYLEDCFNSIKNFSSNVSYEVIVVNNDASGLNNLSKVVKRYNARLLCPTRNIGFGAGVNYGAKNAKGKYILILNPDTEVKSSLRRPMEYLRKRVFDVVGANLIDKAGNSQAFSCGRFHSLVNIFLYKLPLRKYHPWLSVRPIEVNWVSGAVMMMKKSLFDDLAGFSENYFMYFEDQDLCFRVKRMGKKVGFLPNFKVFHVRGVSLQNSKNRLSYYNTSQKIFFGNYAGRFETYLLKLVKPVYDKLFREN